MPLPAFDVSMLEAGSRDDIAAKCSAVAPKPVNVVMGLSGRAFRSMKPSLGVKRVSLGSSWPGAAYGAFLEAAREIRDKEHSRSRAAPYAALNDMFKRYSPDTPPIDPAQ